MVRGVVFGRRDEPDRLVFEEHALFDEEFRQPVIDDSQAGGRARQRIARRGQPQRSGQLRLHVDERPFLQQIVGQFVGIVTSPLGGHLLPHAGQLLLRLGEQVVASQPVEHVGVGVVLVVVDRAPHPLQRIAQGAVERLQGTVTFVQHGGRRLGRDRVVGDLQLFDRFVVRRTSRRQVECRALPALRTQQRPIVGLRKLFAEIGVVHQIGRLQRIGQGSARRTAGRRRRRTAQVEIRQHPILFDRIDPIGQPPPFDADRKELLLAPQNLGRIDRPLRRIVAQLSTHPVDDHRHRILARLQRRLFAQHLHILRIAFQSRDTRRHLLRRGFGGTRCDQHRQKEKSFTHHLHHFRKNNCTSPKISKRPSNINIVFENFITAGRSE